jgi:hypothetical protein
MSTACKERRPFFEEEKRGEERRAQPISFPSTHKYDIVQWKT